MPPPPDCILIFEDSFNIIQFSNLCPRTIGDQLGEAKASGNLGNTLKVLGNFDEAIVCCQRHLDISRELNDKVRKMVGQVTVISSKEFCVLILLP